MMSARFTPLVLLLAPAGLTTAQQPRPAAEVGLAARDWPNLWRGRWFTGDTHEHVQNCDGTYFPPASVLERMRAEGLGVANMLIWNQAQIPFAQLVCEVTGEPDPLSTAAHVLQFGVETAGLDCSKWGHLTALGIGPAEVRVARGSVAEGACEEFAGLGLGCAEGDGTGMLNALVAQHFAAAPGAVTGYAHSGWTLGIHHPQGFDWQAELLATGFTTDARYLDPLQPLAFPDLDELLETPAHSDRLDHGSGGLRSYFPLLGPVDAALGEAQFFETTLLGAQSPEPTTPPANWTGLYYKLLSAGLRVGLTAGSDRACPLPFSDRPQTSVQLPDGLDYGAWIHGVARGRTTIGVPRVRLALFVEGRPIGDDVPLAGPGAHATVAVELAAGLGLADEVELVVGGEVVASRPVELPFGGVQSLVFADVPVARSTWVAARLASRKAHTGATFAIVDGAPVADAATAEYWMMWCDALTKRTLEHPELAFFGCQEAEALERIERARRAFQTLRDVDGIDPEWSIARRGRSTASCRGPLAIGISGPVVAGQPFRLTCTNAPPEAQGVAYVSVAAAPAGTCVDGAEILVGTEPDELLVALPVAATRSGYAEVIWDAPLDQRALLTQFVWQNPPDCSGTSCDGLTATASASDALKISVFPAPKSKGR